MKKKLLPLICLLCNGLLFIHAQNIVFPPAAEGVAFLDVTKPPFNAPKNGIADATLGIQKAIDSSVRYGGSKTIYLPNGTYLVSNTIIWPLYDKRFGDPLFPSNCILQGQSKNGVIIKLKNNCSGFQNEDSAKPILQTGYDVAQCFNNGVRNLTINSGTGNSGAVGLVYYANNIGTSSDLKIVGGDGSIGLDLRGNRINFNPFSNPVTLSNTPNEENGPLFLKNISIQGFEIGIRSGACQNSQTIENLSLSAQTGIPMLHESGVLSIRKLVSANFAERPAIINSGVLTIVDCKLGDGNFSTAAIENSGVLYLRDFEAEYGRGVDSTGGTGHSLATLSASEWSSHKQISLNSGPEGMLKLPIKETPNQVWDSPANWQRVYAPADGTDASAAIQAAIDSGKTTIYFVPGVYLLNKPVYVRGNVRTVYGFNAVIDAQGIGSFVVKNGTYNTVVFNGLFALYSDAFNVTQSSSRVVTIKNCGWSVKKNPGTGDLFIEDISQNPSSACEFYGGNVWARQLNAEKRNGTKIISSNTNLWILGLKTEWGKDGGATLVETKNNGKTEICGFLSNNVFAPDNPSQPMFKITDSKFSAIGLENAYANVAQYTTWINETINGVTKTLVRDSVPLFNCSGAGKTLSLYVSNTVGTTVAVTGITVSPHSYTLPVNRKFTFTGTVLPSNASNKMVLWSTSDTSKATVDLISGEVTALALGTVKVYGTSQEGNYKDSATITVVPNPFVFTVSTSTSATSVNLTTVGTSDWAHWPDYDHKLSGNKKISNYTLVGSGTVSSFSGDPRSISWNDGTPTVNSSNNTSGIYVPVTGSGFQITVPADTNFQTLTLYAGLYSGQGKFSAQLSDSSSPELIDFKHTGGELLDANYSIRFKASSNGQTLTVKWVYNYNEGGNIILHGAALSSDNNIAVSGISLSPKPATVLQGLSLSINAIVTPATATNQTISWTSDNAGIASVSNTGVVTAIAPGTTKIKAVTQDGNYKDSTTLTVTPNPFSFTVNSSSAAVDLTSIGTTDWAHWPGYDHKINGGSKISNYSVIGSGTPGTYGGDARSMSWTNGTPTSGSSNNTSGNFIGGVGNGFQVTVPADTTLQTLILYCGVYADQGKFIAHLSDSSSPDLQDLSISGNGSSKNANYTINFKAASVGQTLTVKWIYNTNGGGNVTLNGAALFPYSAGGSGPSSRTAGAFVRQQGNEPNNKGMKVTVYPNPAADYIRVNVVSEYEIGKVQVQLIDLSGKLVYSGILPRQGNRSNYSIDCASFAKGVYLIKLYSEKWLYTKLVVLQ